MVVDAGADHYEFARGARANSVLSIVLTIAPPARLSASSSTRSSTSMASAPPSGTLSHWMTYSGTLMLVICAATHGCSMDRRDAGAAFVMPALLVAIQLTASVAPGSASPSA